MDNLFGSLISTIISTGIWLYILGGLLNLVKKNKKEKVKDVFDFKKVLEEGKNIVTDTNKKEKKDVIFSDKDLLNNEKLMEDQIYYSVKDDERVKNTIDISENETKNKLNPKQVLIDTTEGDSYYNINGINEINEEKQEKYLDSFDLRKAMIAKEILDKPLCLRKR